MIWVVGGGVPEEGLGDHDVVVRVHEALSAGVSMPSALSSDEYSKRHLPDIEQWSRKMAPMTSRGGLVMA